MKQLHENRRPFLVSSGNTPMIFEFEKQVLNQMSLLVSLRSGGVAADIDGNTAAEMT